MTSLAPIILFVYNRPVHLKKTIEALWKNNFAAESILYIFSDGPRVDAEQNVRQNILEVRKYINTITGFKEIIIKEQEKNIGLDTSIINGVTEVLNKHGKCIVVEDDIITHPWFLRYMNECLDKYQYDKRIWQIGGFINNIKFPWWSRKEVVLIPRCCSWGWGIWKDRWDEINWHPEVKFDPERVRSLCRGGDDLYPMFIEQMKRQVPAWDITFQYTISCKKGYVVMPTKSLTYNIGCDGTGIHCGDIDMSNIIAPFPKGQEYNIHLPQPILTSTVIEKRYKSFQDHYESIFERLIIKLRQFVYK